MTEEEHSEYYANLLIFQYRTLPKARAHIKALATAAFCGGILLKMLDGFSIDRAEGIQLDILGKYIGLTRHTEGTMTETDSTEMDDETYRKLLKFKAIMNASPATTSAIKTALWDAFGGSVRLTDNRDMTYKYVLTIGNETAIIAAGKNLLPAPMGVGVSYVDESDLMVLYEDEFEDAYTEYDCGLLCADYEENGQTAQGYSGTILLAD